MLFLKLIITLILSSLISTEYTPYNYTCKPSDTQSDLEIGDEVTLCLHSKNLKKKVAFKIVVDDYSVISINNGFSKLVSEIEKEKEKEEESSQTDIPTSNKRNLDARNLKREGVLEDVLLSSSSNQNSSNSTSSSSSTQTPASSSSSTTTPTQSSTPSSSSSTTTPTQSSTPSSSSSESTTPSTQTPSTVPDEKSSEEITDEIKEEFIGQIGNVRTKYPSLYYLRGDKDTKSKLFTLFNIVVKVKEGKIYDIVWDNACYDCIKNCETSIKTYDDEVYKNNTMTYSNCYESDIHSCIEKDTTKCDPKFYITWFGTDKQGNQLKTSNLAMSKFTKYSISSLYTSVKNVIN